MRFDLLTIFPDFFAPLDLSLMGKAREAGLIDVHVHDLRDWTEDKHRSVDDTPYGGGAGMVMRPDVWGKALDEVLSAPLPQVDAFAAHEADFLEDDGLNHARSLHHERRVLAIPTPSGVPVTQKMAEDLAHADQIVFACGRYEGIDQRVTDHYRSEEYEVCEFSIGDYVLNGGEVAAMVLIEAVGRLIDGFMGNHESIVEESHSASGLLEYPAYTRPKNWRGYEVPEVLLGGDHGAIERWRRDRALIRTATRRPDMVRALDPDTLSVVDREVLAGAGTIVYPRYTQIRLRLARATEAEELSTFASQNFTFACPDHLSQEAIEFFIAEKLSVAEFTRMLDNPADYRIWIAHSKENNQILGYTLTVLGGPDGMPNEMVRPGKIERGAAYLSKCYVAPEWHGSGIAGALLERAVADVSACARNSQVVLGTNIADKRARAFYKRHGFKVVGRRTFMVGEVASIDDVFVRNITLAKP